MRFGARRPPIKARLVGCVERLQALAIEAVAACRRTRLGFGPPLLRQQRLRQIDGFEVLRLVDEIGHEAFPMRRGVARVGGGGATGVGRNGNQDSIAASQRTKLIASTTPRIGVGVIRDAVAGAAPALG